MINSIETKEQILSDSYSGTIPILISENHVLFPKTTYTCEVSNPVDINLIKHAESNDNLITVTLNGKENNSLMEFYKIGTLAQLIGVNEKSPDHFEIQLIGLEKVEIFEAVSNYSFKIGTVSILHDIKSSSDNDYEKKRLVESFSRFIHVSHHSMEKSLIHYPLINKEMLTNIISSLIPISNKEQQKLLELPDLGLRLEIVCQYLENDGDKKEKDDILSIFDPIPINWN
ncbi:MAG: LON peptidase substrate-binding domain-containing protein [Candidatus Marinimicrobia bacterium]|jgi:ATP-dependent Lon protease|nr:LON peptidase substrate-binding domain-containing protein [Candidatus Neomarinimicrobiota bacterium]MBT3633947.1 LON peptidase substrate-binding domain-containing protein [Candidatus Neomarinimicrobiota bacterium]MBT3682804.1 LON peptidase substrate-binding domain-containing protein [Candidatus Neomarinimicrobiota bacterium]MBT3760009.1 LON peptidase substrate-binding domain-containing protein [Candidatus Neomarinimicrobiota bacterium]MBT3896103.1 LON peptidase substrate-binding domain-conta